MLKIRCLPIGLTIVLLLASPALAVQPDVGSGFGGGKIDVSASKGSAAPGAGGATTVKQGTGGSGTGWVDPTEGMSCWEIYSNALKQTCGYIAPGEECPETVGNVAGPVQCLFTTLDPVDPAVAAAQRAAAARQYAIDYFKSLPLPVPQPKLSALEGTTGAVHQLDLQVPQQATFNDPSTPFGTLTVRCYGTFTVDWGDGTKGTYTTTGAPYPNSSITHTWTDRGTYDVVVTGRWSADWTFGEYSGTLSGLTTNGSLVDFPVGDLQAVITR